MLQSLKIINNAQNKKQTRNGRCYRERSIIKELPENGIKKIHATTWKIARIEIEPIIEHKHIKRDHQIEWRRLHITVEQVHRVSADAKRSFKEKNIVQPFF